MTSTKLNEAGLPQLEFMLDRGFEYAVAFHGYQAEGEQVIIGGNCLDFKCLRKSMGRKLNE